MNKQDFYRHRLGKHNQSYSADDYIFAMEITNVVQITDVNTYKSISVTIHKPSKSSSWVIYEELVSELLKRETYDPATHVIALYNESDDKEITFSDIKESDLFYLRARLSYRYLALLRGITSIISSESREKWEITVQCGPSQTFFADIKRSENNGKWMLISAIRERLPINFRNECDDIFRLRLTDTMITKELLSDRQMTTLLTRMNDGEELNVIHG